MAAAPAMLTWMSSLADATRARTLRLIERHELTVADLCAVLQLPQSTVSRHLKVLADDGWVAARPEGTSRLYRMTLDRLDPAARRLWALVREQAAGMRAAAQDDQRLAAVLSERQARSQAFFSSAAGEWDQVVAAAKIQIRQPHQRQGVFRIAFAFGDNSIASPSLTWNEATV